MTKITIKKVENGQYKVSISNGHTADIYGYENKWNCTLLDDDGDHEAYWYGKTKKEMIDCLYSYYAI